MRRDKAELGARLSLHMGVGWVKVRPAFGGLQILKCGAVPSSSTAASV